jgi:hypothetical protein
MNAGYKTISLFELLEDWPEVGISKILTSYSCALNSDLETFVREKALEFSKSSLARTFLVFAEHNGADVLAGFFALTGKSMLVSEFSDLSHTYVKKIARFSEYYPSLNAQLINVILIAQLGKNYANGYSDLITGNDLLALAYEKIKAAERLIGGKLVCIECVDNPQLIAFYEANDFRRFQNRANNGSGSPNQPEYFVQMIKYM